MTSMNLVSSCYLLDLLLRNNMSDTASQTWFQFLMREGERGGGRERERGERGGLRLFIDHRKYYNDGKLTWLIWSHKEKEKEMKETRSLTFIPSGSTSCFYVSIPITFPSAKARLVSGSCRRRGRDKRTSFQSLDKEKFL